MNQVVNGPTSNVRRSIKISGHMTSVTLEDQFYSELRAIARRKGKKLSELVTEIDAGRTNSNLSSSLRTFVLADALARAATSRQPAS